MHHGQTFEAITAVPCGGRDLEAREGYRCFFDRRGGMIKTRGNQVNPDEIGQ